MNVSALSRTALRSLSFLVFIWLVQPVSGQSTKFSFTLGEVYDLPRKTEDLAFFGNDKDGIVNLSIKRDELNIIRFDSKTLKKSSEQRIELEDGGKNFASEELIDFRNGNYYWLHSDWDNKSETEFLYYDRVDVAKGQLAERNKKMVETTKLAYAPIGGGYSSARKYDFNYDNAHKKLLVSYRYYPEFRSDKKNIDRVGLQVFDENMKKIWSGEFTMPYTEAVMDNSRFSIDGNGNAYLLAKVYDSDSRKEVDKGTGLPAFHYEILKFSQGNKKITIVPLKVGEYFIRETTLTENAQHDMIVATTYSKNPKGNSVDGVYLATVNQAGKLVQFKNGYYEFPIEELKKYETAKMKRKMDRKDDYEATNIKVRDVAVEPDGGIFLTMEEYLVVQHTRTNSQGMISGFYYTWHYNDMFGAKINADGKFEWLRKIPKKQMGSSGTGTMGFKFVNDASGYYFLYLDNLKNLHLPEDEAPRQHSNGYGGQVIVSRISKDGVVSKELLFDTREEEIMIFPTAFDRINGNQFIGRARVRKNSFQPILITTVLP